MEDYVVARITFHSLREERAFQISKSLNATSDPHGDHIVQPIDLIRLNPGPGDRAALAVSIYQSPGPNFLVGLMDMGPAHYRARKDGDNYVSYRPQVTELQAPIGLDDFLDFAVGAVQCLEILHHGHGIVHGEIRADAFHFNHEDNKVRIVSFGSGLRSFEHGLTSTGWLTLSKEVGVKNKLLYISPEQTGRMPAEPDSRTDIYSLGILLWSLLTQQPVYSGDTPMDIIQGVLGRKIPNVATVRMDVPDVIGRIIQRCTAKNVADRYHSASGLRHDLVAVQDLLSDGDSAALQDFQIGSRDVSSFFILPTDMVGHQTERSELIRVIDRVWSSHHLQHGRGPKRLGDPGSQFNEHVLVDDASSDAGTSSAGGTNQRSGSFTHTNNSADIRHTQTGAHHSVASDAQTMSNETMSSGSQGALPRPARPWERHASLSLDSASAADSAGADGSRFAMTDSSAGSNLSRQLGAAKFRRRGSCEIVTVEGAAGLGKSFLVQSVQAEARRRGYCATAKFDATRRTAFGPLLKLLSSLFKQVWGERNTETPFHQGLKHYIRPVWPMLHRALGLPEFLLGGPENVVMSALARPLSNTQAAGFRGSPSLSSSSKLSNRRRGSSPGVSPGRQSQAASNVSSQTSQDYLCTGSSTKTTRLMNICLDVLRVFTTHKFICFCLDDLHFADAESMELITQIIGAKMKMLIIMTYRPEELSREQMEKLIQPAELDGRLLALQSRSGPARQGKANAFDQKSPDTAAPD